MSTHLTLSAAVILMAMTAFGYAIATLGMKMAAGTVTASALALIVAGLLCAALAEINLLRTANLAVIYLGIVALESLLVLAFAAVIGDKLNLQQLAGAGLVMGGFFLVATPD